MRNLLMGLAIGVGLLTGCSDITAPVRTLAPSTVTRDVIAPNPDGTCKSGYSVATGRNGETICVSDDGQQLARKSR